MMTSEYGNDPKKKGSRLLTVNGIHVLEKEPPCLLENVEPPGAVKDLGWTGQLALEAVAEGRAVVACGAEKTLLEFADPVRLEITTADGRDPLSLQTGERLRVRARLFDRLGIELETGKFTHFEWCVSEPFEEAIDRSAGEFGYCDTCYGQFAIRAVKPGTGTIEARLGGLRGALKLAAEP